MDISEEIIDGFLRGDLNAADTAAFNAAISADPKLQQEVSIQKDIVEALKSHRHQQLKNRLNSVDVKPAGLFGSSYLKLAASMGVVALFVGSFAVFTGNQEEDALVTDGSKLSEQNQHQAIQASENISETTPDNITGLASSIENKAASVTSKTTAVDSKNKISKTSATENADKKSVKTPSYTTDIAPEEMDGGFTIQPQTDGVDMSAINHGSVNNTTSQVKVNIVKDKDLAYRFFNNQLYLHGNFSNSTYELYELNNSPSKQLFLYFDGKYYELIQGKTKVTTLTPITDKATLTQLSQLKAH
ncbi:hypothetical protein [Cytophaga hutchinsonii]|jgi:hypothetical protein|uniref:Uncharacterized protein n=1 Tax=Cytophaga hutchinsonii (strain ATCC 33406 / DSM 1761 / CIP 103989 / NBRC 15051 / NCIMB 9469 / D465) TaxID=269798 RepID=A0A6N4SPK4_CYTH3|nr:hypothetical protein [Cytophaga hutchinsonii]ABG58229.1 hypothetical protein CHU_0952 [Cytophaga hutchinsonii ATCC 33406]SFX54516.1 hypothetical protein SAMN04487930_105203 [Cytophaga hutchinsonii ATCC 33406]